MIPARIAWLDALRGATILLVVLHHAYLGARAVLKAAAMKPGAAIGSEIAAGALPHWTLHVMDDGLGLMRMSAFFLCSGLLFSYCVGRGWRWFLGARLLFAVWVIGVWTMLEMAAHVAGLPLYPWIPGEGAIPWAQLFWVPKGNLWFLYAIAILGALAMALRPLPPAGQALAAGALALAAFLSIGRLGLPAGLSLLHYNLGMRGILFFMLGVLLAGPALRLPPPGPAQAAAALGGVGLTMLFVWSGVARSPATEVLVSLPATLAFVQLLRFAVARAERLGRLLAWLGARSLQILVTHQFGVGLACLPLGEGLAVHMPPDLAVIFVFVSALSVSLALSWALGKAPGNLAFRAPRIPWARPRPAGV